jgi:DNA-binding transcriptional ArsR family regulator
MFRARTNACLDIRGRPPQLCVTEWLPIMHRAQANSDIYHAIADPTRRAILDRLRSSGAAPVNTILRDFPQSRPAISRHLRVLREARVVVEQRVGRERVYRIRAEELQRVAQWIDAYRSFWQTSLDALKKHLEAKK